MKIEKKRVLAPAMGPQVSGMKAETKITTLGLIITSDRYPHYILPLVHAACQQGLNVLIHLSGSGVRLLLHPDFCGLTHCCQLGVCLESITFFKLNKVLEKIQFRNPVPVQSMDWIIQHCDRQVFI